MQIILLFHIFHPFASLSLRVNH